MKKILFVGAEAMPFASTGGLGDVLGSLPAALAATGEADVRVMLPLYRGIGSEWRESMTKEAEFEVQLAWRRLYCGVFSLESRGVTYYFVDNEYYFDRPALYGEYDDGERFAYFCMASLAALSHLDFYPDVLHAHDWQSALSVVYLSHLFHAPEYARIKTVFTIHNIEYQGKFSHAILEDVFSLSEGERDLLDFDGCINLMKSAIITADRVTTVSPRYAAELLTPEHAHGLDGVLRDNAHKLTGILNGIDDAYYDPARDQELALNFTWRSRGRKTQNKLALQKELGLPQQGDTPLCSIVSRLASHKGLDIALPAVKGLLATREVQLVVLGCGEARFEAQFSALQREYPDRVRALLYYDREIAKRIYAASDIFLMPSRSEPCGLSQMIASRYGAIPVVREVGGLYDSIKPYFEENGNMYGNGFTFAGYSADELYERTCAALDLFRDAERKDKLISRIMRTDFSWRRSAGEYLKIYEF